jgi:hypothetical protein
MGSVRAMNPVKLFIGVLAMEDWQLEDRLEERVISEFGALDHRQSLIPSDESIHRVLISFDRLIETGDLERIRQISTSIEAEYSAKLDVGLLDNRSVSLAADPDVDVIQFKDGGIQVLPWPHPGRICGKSSDFFRTMRKTYRSQLRTMCLLRR